MVSGQNNKNSKCICVKASKYTNQTLIAFQEERHEDFNTALSAMDMMAQEGTQQLEQ